LWHRNEQLATLTIRHAVPAITQYREFATAGGLMSYGGSKRGNITEELYTSRAAIEAVMRGKQLPRGTVITMED
jgi:hypothetical protein